MEWKFTLALAVAVPVILFPAAFVWYTNASALYTAITRFFKHHTLHQAENAYLKATVK